MKDEETNNTKSQPSDKRSEEGRKRSTDERGTLLHDRQNSSQGNPIRYFSMFTGVGGFELGLERANDNEGGKFRQPKKLASIQYAGDSTNINGRRKPKQEEELSSELKEDLYKRKFKCIGVSEIDKYSSELLSKKFPTIKNWGDCTKINPSELPDFDMLCGGFPCQAFSIAGKRRGFKDTRGTLFFEIARILEVKRPKLVLLENVKGLLNHEKGKTFSVILQTLEELGYEVQWMVLNSKFFGVPQNRERVFIIGSLRGERRPEILPLGESKQEPSTESMEGKISSTITSTYWKGNKGTQIKVEGMLTEGGWDKRHENIRRVYSQEGISPTIPTGQGGGVMPKISTILDLYNKKEHSDRCPTLTEPHHNTIRVREGFKIRRLTPTECERLQGFPDGWTEGFSDTQRYKMMGNAVTTNIITAIGIKLSQSRANTSQKGRIVNNK